jgi:tryptophan synthase beta chain
VGPEHSFLKDSQRARYTFVTDDEALDAFHRLSELEGIIPALESAHAVAHLLRHGGDYDGPVVVCLSGRGDKDVAHVARLEGRGSLL